ncbi:DUF1428 domain-containing protein, partial [Escherichia coli]
MKYVDGFVVAVPADKKDAYREMAAKAAPLFKEFGALRIVECWASDVPDAKWHLNRSQFGIRIDHDLASISDHSLASQSIT